MRKYHSLFVSFICFTGKKKIDITLVETPNDGGGDGTDNRPINGEPELACIVQDQEMEEGIMIFFYISTLSKLFYNLETNLQYIYVKFFY